MLQLLGMVISTLGTIAFVAYRVGKLEGVVLERLDDYKRRIEDLEADRRHWIRRLADHG